MKLHYFDQEKADENDIQLKMAINQGYVPETCLLSGIVVMSEIQTNRNPCDGCACDRTKCKSERKRTNP